MSMVERYEFAARALSEIAPEARLLAPLPLSDGSRGLVGLVLSPLDGGWEATHEVVYELDSGSARLRLPRRELRLAEHAEEGAARASWGELLERDALTFLRDGGLPSPIAFRRLVPALFPGPIWEHVRWLSADFADLIDPWDDGGASD